MACEKNQKLENRKAPRSLQYRSTSLAKCSTMNTIRETVCAFIRDSTLVGNCADTLQDNSVCLEDFSEELIEPSNECEAVVLIEKLARNALAMLSLYTSENALEVFDVVQRIRAYITHLHNVHKTLVGSWIHGIEQS